MLIFIDESGDPGFKLGRGSTSHFVVSMVIFDKNEDAESASKIIQQALADLKIKPEFKFNKSSDKIRDAFFDKVKNCKFRVRALVVDKERIYSKNLREDDEKFYNYFVRLLIDFQELKLTDVSIKIDGSGDREFKKELNRYLRSKVKSGFSLKIELVDSHKNHLIQLADMVAGAIAKSYPNQQRQANDSWKQSLGKKIENIWDFK